MAPVAGSNSQVPARASRWVSASCPRGSTESRPGGSSDSTVASTADGRAGLRITSRTPQASASGRISRGPYCPVLKTIGMCRVAGSPRNARASP
jgi:hypothetical protein